MHGSKLLLCHFYVSTLRILNCLALNYHTINILNKLKPKTLNIVFIVMFPYNEAKLMPTNSCQFLCLSQSLFHLKGKKTWKIFIFYFLVGLDPSKLLTETSPPNKMLTLLDATNFYTIQCTSENT